MAERPRTLAGRALPIVVAAVVVVAGVSVAGLANWARADATARAEDAMGHLASAAADATSARLRALATGSESLARARSELERDAEAATDPKVADARLAAFDSRAAEASRAPFRAVRIIAENGREVASFGDGERRERSPKDWRADDAFAAAMGAPDATLVFAPAPRDLGGEEPVDAVLVARAFTRADGSARGVVAGLVPVDDLAADVAAVAAPHGGSVHLARLGLGAEERVPEAARPFLVYLPAARDAYRGEAGGVVAAAAAVGALPQAGTSWEESWWVIVTADEDAVLASATRALATAAAAAVVAVAFVAAAAWWSVRRATRPLEDVQKAVEHIGAGDYSTRATVDTGDELARLASVVNGLSGALEARETERRRYTAHRLQTEKLASLGSLVAGVAHEINNPLAFIRGNDELEQDVVGGILARPDVPPDVASELSVLLDLSKERLEGVRRITKIVSSLRQFAKPSLERDPVDVGAAVEAALTLAGPKTRGRIRVNARVSPGLPMVLGNADELGQVFLNLIVNAAEAMGDGPGRLDVHAGQDEPDVVRVEFHDSGPGVPAEVAARLFNPFFTTKPSGTGLGLSISQRIVAEHGGTLTHRNGREGGAVFTVRLPAVRDAAALALAGAATSTTSTH